MMSEAQGQPLPPESGIIRDIQSAAAESPVDLGSASADNVPAFQTIPYDPARARESVRGWIALSLIALFALMMSVSFAFMWVHPDRSKELHDLLALLLGPLVALVGAATGYYFGSKAGQ